MKKKYLYMAGGLTACLFLLYACSDDEQYASAAPVVVQQPVQAQQPAQPVIVQSQPQQPVVVQNGGHEGFFSGMLMGHLMSGGSHHTHTRVEHHYTTPRYRPQKRYYGSRSTYRSTYRSYRRR